MSNLYPLMKLLADGEFHSGESLGETLGITRAAVWKQIQALEKIDVEVFAVRGQGYRLSSPITLLDVGAIQSTLSNSVSNLLEGIEVLDQVDSTNDYLKEKLDELAPGCGRVCLAEWQKQGRGRRGRRWVSPYANSLCFSLAWHLAQPNFPVTGLSLAAAVAVIRALAKSGIEGLTLKWPNDIFLNGGKLAGILTELVGEASGAYRLVIGVGVNINMSETIASQIDQPWSALSSVTGRVTGSVDRNTLAGLIINEMVGAIRTFSEEGLNAFIDAWHQHDLTTGQPIELHRANDVIRGIGQGIDANGALRIAYNGEVKSFHAGEVSVRLSP